MSESSKVSSRVEHIGVVADLTLKPQCSSTAPSRTSPNFQVSSTQVHIPHTSHLTSSTSSLPASDSSTLHLVTAGDANVNILCFDSSSTGTGLCFGRPGDNDVEKMQAVQSSIPGSVGGDAVEAGDVDVEWLGEGVLGVVGRVMFVELVGGNAGLSGEG
ncbi:uncharacterized protein EDB91DRAFT_1249412 [Suillus paluster]|uniref:uncharacterized protein n=1 Tax=Suillus paluster TaxID=48578 RepID=UPI001B86606D|nr:uncharacterized protein EDB91DRAFT_1249412 [Suillus paluster]KAG1738103.1 hypothetical protein EDB91DRAFT_1249412 [Suillus paluster]